MGLSFVSPRKPPTVIVRESGRSSNHKVMRLITQTGAYWVLRFRGGRRLRLHAADALLFFLGRLLHVGRRLRIFARELAEGRTGGVLLFQRSKRLPKAQQRVRRLPGSVELGRDGEERFRRLAIALAL